MGEQGDVNGQAGRDGQSEQVDPGTGGGERRPEAERKAKLVFGDPLDRQSSDDTDRGWGESSGTGGAKRGLDWYLSQRPPHHGE
ncbi:hypothetical protein CFP65_4528 [Kitasatospora sp. MMS16-BH015]|uniref:hypothetical protein n=1 Tax=Kitasatospora sp. MMS16-BH015 TaxID=2018025 RepID=UPI000CA16597|nr:hypothetical protein CFP65_4528 [Kitasatospora sp. MMS16-BH015]